MVFHPTYTKVGRAMIDASVVNIVMLIDWVNTCWILRY
jgi:hypothetical protein